VFVTHGISPLAGRVLVICDQPGRIHRGKSGCRLPVRAIAEAWVTPEVNTLQH